MLSRVADSLYWMSRYMERAEDITRALTVNFNALLDQPTQDAAASWRALVSIASEPEAFDAIYSKASAHTAISYLLWDENNPNSVTACMNLARENARTVRDQISSEMWEVINGLYYRLKDIDREAVLRGPTDLFASVRDGSHAFQGVTHATITHSDGFHFIQLGKHLERAEKTARILDAKYAELDSAEEGSPQQTIQLSVMLRSCSAMEAYRKSARTLLATDVIAFLLLNREFPRSVMFCMNSVVDALRRISDASQSERRDGPIDNAALRSAGRIASELTYLELDAIMAGGLNAFVRRQVAAMNTLGDDITRTFFNAQVILPGWRSYLQQVQQQQQQ
jgi:uncharacterized alpha-E superfamily protein